MEKTVVISGVRTPFGKFGGGLDSFSASELGGFAIKGVLERANVEANHIDEVIFGHVLQGGQGQLSSRQAAREAGIPWHVKTETINKVCASGIRAVTMADQIIRSGDAEVIVAGGMESMTNTPHMIPNFRWGTKMGHTQLVDVMLHDGLTCSFTGVHMGTYGNLAAKKYNISRSAQDEWAYKSHKRTIRAKNEGYLAQEIIPIELPQKKGAPLILKDDESPRSDTSPEKLSQLRPVFDTDGTIILGNAPGINDGAAALLLMSETRAKKEKKKPIASILAHTAVAVEAERFPETPGFVINQLLRKTGKSVEEIDLFEINEAFAAVVLVSSKIAKLDLEKVNVNGGAIAMGHPIGASGTRIILSLVYELRRRGGGLGVAAICSGGGQGDALLIEVPKQ